jgi:hypothetical protein
MAYTQTLRHAPGDRQSEFEQRSLFEPDSRPAPQRTVNRAPIAAKADPITSLLAAQNLTLSGARSAKKRRLVEFLRTCREPLTSLEISRALDLERHDVAKRLPDARRDGHLQNGPMRNCRVSGRLGVTWKAVCL